MDRQIVRQTDRQIDRLINRQIDSQIDKIFNVHYINIVENSSSITPSTTENPNNPLEDSNLIKDIIEQNKNPPNIINIRRKKKGKKLTAKDQLVF